MMDMVVLSVAMEQEAKRLPRREDALRAEWRKADETGEVGPLLRSALRCAVFDDPLLRERAKKLERSL